MATDNPEKSLVDRIRGARERVKRTETSRRADKRASARRLRQGEPETASEKATVKKREAERKAQMTADEARGLAGDAKSLIATETGVSGEQAESIISRSAEVLSSARGQLDRLDLDGDGDTDILEAIESGGGVEARSPTANPNGSRPQDQRVEPPVGDIEDDFGEVSATGVESEIGFDFPIEDDI